jgi:hypothetical protein
MVQLRHAAAFTRRRFVTAAGGPLALGTTAGTTARNTMQATSMQATSMQATSRLLLPVLRPTTA